MQNENILSLIKQEGVAQNTRQFTFQSDQKIIYRAGQYADYTLINPQYSDEKGSTRAFSFVSSPDEDVIKIATRFRQPLSAFKQSLGELRSGDKIKTSQPMGSFVLHQDVSRPAIFLIGGIGITPIHSIIKDSTQKLSGHKLYLFYGNKNPEETAFRQDFDQWMKSNKDFQVIYVFSDEQYNLSEGEKGLISAQIVKKYIPEDVINQAYFYISGPPQMVNTMQRLATDDLSINLDYIKTEEFDGY